MSWHQSTRSTPSERLSGPVLRGYPLALRQLASAAILGVEADYLLDRQRRAVAVVEVLGSDPAVADEYQQASRLAALQHALERFEEPMMRLSSSRPQEVTPYLAALESVYRWHQQHGSPLTRPLAEVAETLEHLAASGQARVGMDYWALALPIPVTMWRPGQGHAAASAQLGTLLEDRCSALLWSLERAGMTAQRVTGARLAQLSLSCWRHPALPLPDLEGVEGAEWDAAAREPLGNLLMGSKVIQTPSGYMTAWLVQDFGSPLPPDVFMALAREPGVRILQFWEQVPAGLVKRTLKFNRTIEGSLHYFRPTGEVRDYDRDLRLLLNDAQRARLAFQDEKVFRYRAIIQLWANDLADLEAEARRLKQMLEQKEVRAQRANLRRLREALVAGLPLAVCPLEHPERNLDAASLAQLITPGPRDPLQPMGIWLGQTLPSGLLATYDFFALQNPVVELTGIMGSGKSLAQKSFLTQYASLGYPCFVVDCAQHEYTRTVEALGGLVLPLGRADGPAFNPVQFDPLDAEAEGDPFLTGQTRFLDWLEAALRPLSELEQVVVGAAYQRALAAAGILREDPETWELSPPLLAAVWAALREEPADPELAGTNYDARLCALALARLLHPLTVGPTGALFNRPTDLQVGTAQVICFDLFDVPERLRLPMFQQVLSYIGRQTLRRHRFTGSVVILDEAHLLLEDARSARALEHLVRNGRKARQLLFFTQHTYTDSALNRSAQLAHKTAGATLVFHINPQDEGTLADLHLTREEMALVTQLDQPEGECLLLAPSGHYRLHIGFPPGWYARFTTKPLEVLAELGAAWEEPGPNAASQRHLRAAGLRADSVPTRGGSGALWQMRQSEP